MNSIKIYIRIAIFLSLLAFSFSGVYAYDDLKQINLTDQNLPKTGTFTFLFPRVGDATLEFELNESSDKVNLQFPSSYTFANNDTQFNFVVTWNISAHLIADNETYKESIRVTNTENNIVSLLGFHFNIEKTEEKLVNINSTDELQIINGRFVKSIGALDLPNKGNLTFRVNGESDEFFDIVGCGDYLICPGTQFRFNENGSRVVSVGYSVPFGTVIGSYNTSFRVESESQNNTINVTMAIVTPNFILQPLELDPKCVSTAPFDIQRECFQKLAEYNAKIFVELNKYQASINTEKLCEEYKDIRYVVGDSIDDEIIQRNKEVLDENARLRDDLDDKSEDLLTCRFEVIELNNTIVQVGIAANQSIDEIRDEEVTKRINQAQASLEGEYQYKQEVTGEFMFLIGILIVFCLLGMGWQFYWLRARGGRVIVPQIVLGVIAGSLSVVFLALWFVF